jgi:hypothetical protein
MPLVWNSYANYQDLQDQGLDPTTFTEAQAKVALLMASQLIEKYTRNFFREETGTFIFDGNNSHILHLPIPILTVTSLTVNNGSTVLDSDWYRAHTGRSFPTDDRRNPKIELRRSSTASSSIYVVNSATTDIFVKGLDQTIVGTFGYLEPDDSVPLAVKQAVMILAIECIQLLYPKYGNSTIAGSTGTVGPVKKEEADDHSKEWHNLLEYQQLEEGLWAPAAKALLYDYRAPRSIAVTAARWSVAGYEGQYGDYWDYRAGG